MQVLQFSTYPEKKMKYFILNCNSYFLATILNTKCKLYVKGYIYMNSVHLK